MSSAQEHTVETAAPTAADIAHSNTLMSADELAAMNDTGDEAELLARVAGDDDEADEAGDDEDAADDGAAPIEESAAKPAEDKPAEKAAEKAAEKPAATSESTDDEDEAVAPVFAFKLPDDFDAQVNANKQALADLRKQRDDGDIDMAEYDAQAEKLLEQRDDLRRMRDKADIAAEAQKTADQQRVDRAVKDAFRAALADGVDYRNDNSKAADLDEFACAAMSNSPSGASLNGCGWNDNSTQALWWDGVANTATPSTVAAGQARRQVVAWDAGGYSISANGSTPTTVAGRQPWPSARSALQLGGIGSIQYINGPIKRVRYWRKRLANAQLQALTA